MKQNTSFAINILRVVAATWVFVYHCVYFFYTKHFESLKSVGHNAVILFFVLSGYVIAYSVLGRGVTNFKDYAVARVSKLYSVVIPAIILTVALWLIGRNVAMEYYVTRQSR